MAFGFVDNFHQTIFLGFSFNNSMAFGFADKFSQSNFSRDIQSFSLYLILENGLILFYYFFKDIIG
jgi:hypothetical protein